MTLAPTLLLLAALAAPDTGALARLEGRWTGAGTWLGKPASARASWTPALAGRFVRLEYRVTRDGESKPVFEGDAYYSHGPDGLSGTWFDSQGSVHTLKVVSEKDALVVSWPAAEPRGRTCYRLLEDGALEITDEAKGKDGAWREFARMRYSRE
jgi:hypothetical protein